MKRKMIGFSAALLCTLTIPMHAQAAVMQPHVAVSTHSETLRGQLPGQVSIQKPQRGRHTRPSQGGSLTPGNKPAQMPGAPVAAGVAEQMLKEVNAVRARNGLSPLRLDAAMNRAANVRAAEIAKNFSHTRPNGARGLTALQEAGISYRTAGENIASGQQSVQAVVSAWMGSEGHRANILSSRFGRLGVGYATIGGRTYWVQLFAN